MFLFPDCWYEPFPFIILDIGSFAFNSVHLSFVFLSNVSSWENDVHGYGASFEESTCIISMGPGESIIDFLSFIRKLLPVFLSSFGFSLEI